MKGTIESVEKKGFNGLKLVGIVSGGKYMIFIQITPTLVLAVIKC